MTIVFAVLSLICLAYGFVVKAVGSGSVFFAVWLGLGAIFALLAALFGTGLWGRLPAHLRGAAGVFAVVIIAAVIITECFVLGGFSSKAEKDLDCIIVLGAQVKENGPSSVLKYRLDKALEYMDENPGTVCILSGGRGSNEPCTEAEGMADYLISAGADPERLILEDQSLNTVQNISFSMRKAQLIGSRVGIVTNNFHVFRAVRIAKKQGLTEAVGIPAYSNPLYLPNNMFREFFGIMKDLIKGNM